MAEKTLFERIIDREIPATIIYEDEHCIVFRDINPQAPTHVLVVPRKPIPSLDDVTPEEALLTGHLLLVARRVAADEGLADGYRVVINCGPDGGQSVDHLHMHMLGGRKLKWPPG
jgi:histidine triad (HIT) family protein